MKIDFYYWGTQCPINFEIIDLLSTYKEHFDLNLFDISQNLLLAKEQRMFFPFLTVVDGERRYRGPLTKNTLEKIISGELEAEKPFIMNCGSEIYNGTITPLTGDNIKNIVHGCTVTECDKACIMKKEFLDRYLDNMYGFVNMKDDKVLGGAEYVPSMVVPYDIPREEDTAFLTCVYHSTPQFDYKITPLQELEKYLKDKYKKLLAISDEEGCFPNGTLKWFIANGYKDMGIISKEENFCSLHLVCKEL